MTVDYSIDSCLMEPPGPETSEGPALRSGESETKQLSASESSLLLLLVWEASPDRAR